jgi:hypothetical protein
VINESKKWSLQQLKQAMNKDLRECNSDFERSNIKGVCIAEIRERAIEIKTTRSLTSSEIKILSSLCIYL